MNESFELDERKRNEVVNTLYRSLMDGWDIPRDICEHYGFYDDYQLYHRLENMEPAEYRKKRLDGEVPDVMEVDTRLTHAVEQVFERLCSRPPNPYIDRLYGELVKLGSIASNPKNADGPFVYTDFLMKYGIERNSTDEIRRKQAEDAYRKLDMRLSRMTGRKSQKENEATFRHFKVKPYQTGTEKPSGKIHIPVGVKPKGRKMRF